jgi:hypothetical protein
VPVRGFKFPIASMDLGKLAKKDGGFRAKLRTMVAVEEEEVLPLPLKLEEKSSWSEFKRPLPTTRLSK